MAFNSPEDLHSYLEGLQPGYGARYAHKLWNEEVRYSEEIENASEATLQKLGVLAAHSGNLFTKATAHLAGTQTATFCAGISNFLAPFPLKMQALSGWNRAAPLLVTECSPAWLSWSLAPICTACGSEFAK